MGVVRVIRLIPKGAEVNIDYGFDFYATPLDYRQKKALAGYHFKCGCVACSHKWPVYDRLVERPPQYKKKLTPELTMEVARQAACYQAAMEQLVRLDIPRALPILAQYLTVMSDLIVHPDAIFPTMSFFNHSCYPNATRLGFQNHQVVRVIRLIPKGAEVNIDYGFDFYATPL